AEGGDQRTDLLVVQRAVQPRLLDVEDLAADREDRLRVRVAAGDGGAAGGVALDDEDLGLGGVAGGAVAQLAGHPAGLQRGLAPGRVARLPGRLAGGRG